MGELSENAQAAYAANPAFYQAAEIDSKQLLKEPSEKEQLHLYGLYKIGCNESIEAAKAAEEKAKEGRSVLEWYKTKKVQFKLKTWEEALKEGLTAEQAQERYIAYVAELREKIGFDPNRVVIPRS